MQTQVTRDFEPSWGVGADLRFYPRGSTPPTNIWWLVVLDDSDQANALGYHDVTPAHQPMGKAFARSDMESGHKWTVTMSHELLEMLGDPWLNRAVQASIDGRQKLLACEVCDACEDDGFAYAIGDTQVSDFVLPGWFDPMAPGRQFDFRAHITAPLQLLPGGYIGVFDAADGWTQIHADNVRKQFDAGLLVARKDAIPLGGRRDRRFRRGLGAPMLRSGAPLEAGVPSRLRGVYLHLAS